MWATIMPTYQFEYRFFMSLTVPDFRGEIQKPDPLWISHPGILNHKERLNSIIYDPLLNSTNRIIILTTIDKLSIILRISPPPPHLNGIIN